MRTTVHYYTTLYFDIHYAKHKNYLYESPQVRWMQLIGYTHQR